MNTRSSASRDAKNVCAERRQPLRDGDLADEDIPTVLQRDRLTMRGRAAVPGAVALDRELDACREIALPEAVLFKDVTPSARRNLEVGFAVQDQDLVRPPAKVILIYLLEMSGPIRSSSATL